MDTKWMHACGPAGVVLLLAGNSMAGTTPPTDAGRQEVQAYLGSLDPSWPGVMLEMLGLLALLVFFAALSRRPADGTLRTLVLAGGVAGVTLKFATALPQIAVWMRPSDVDAGTAVVIFGLGTIGFSISGALFALVPAAMAASGLLPRWLRIAGAVVAVALLAQIPLFREEFGLGFLLLMLWIVATGITSMRATSRTREPHGRAGSVRPHPA